MKPEQILREALLGLLPPVYLHKVNPNHSKDEVYCCIDCYDDDKMNIARKEMEKNIKNLDLPTLIERISFGSSAGENTITHK
ncbi:MAG TPA: hypothetical protein VIJ14_00905 [Rhabdochlamydiaceae bacterium]